MLLVEVAKIRCDESPVSVWHLVESKTYDKAHPLLDELNFILFLTFMDLGELNFPMVVWF